MLKPGYSIMRLLWDVQIIVEAGQGIQIPDLKNAGLKVSMRGRRTPHSVENLPSVLPIIWVNSDMPPSDAVLLHLDRYLNNSEDFIEARSLNKLPGTKDVLSGLLLKGVNDKGRGFSNERALRWKEFLTTMLGITPSIVFHVDKDNGACSCKLEKEDSP